MITGDILKKIAPSLSTTDAFRYAGIIDSVCPQYGINTPDIMHEFIARLCVECGEFKTFTESLNYSASALMSKFSRERISTPDCFKYGRLVVQKANQQAIANCIYGGKWGKINLGNIQANDGWTFRGSGAIQMTGRGLVTAFTNFYNKKFLKNFTPEQMAELLRNDFEVGIHAACWFFAIHKKLIQLAIDDEINAIVKKINGGFNGLEETKLYLKRAVQYIT